MDGKCKCIPDCNAHVNIPIGKTIRRRTHKMTTTQAPESTKIHKVHEFGFVSLEDSMGGDLAIVNSARVSFNEESDEMDAKNIGLINFLMKNKHGTPFEAPVFHFTVKAPLFVTREWMRHRIGSFNEWSARYSVIEPEYYTPEKGYIREQKGKAGAYYYEPMTDIDKIHETQYLLDYAQRESFRAYNRMLELGVAKEVARVVLPVGMMTKFKWTINLRALMNFLSLRNHEHAQKEIRDFAIVIEELVSEVCPVAMAAFVEHGRVSA